MRGNPAGIQQIGVIAVQHRPVCNGQGQVHRPAAAGVMGEIHPQQPPAVVKSRIIVDAEIVPFAGDDHVVVSVITHLAGSPRRPGSDSAGHSQRIALRLLAAKAAAHAPHFNPHGVHRHTQRLGNLMLNFRRVLRAGMDGHVAALLRQSEGDLTLQIKMLLPAHIDPALHAVRGAGQGGDGIALGPDTRPIFEPAVCGQRLLDRQDRSLCRNLDLAQSRRAAGGQMAVGHNGKDRLSGVMHPVHSQQRLVVVAG